MVIPTGDIDVLLKNAVNIDAMNLYGSDAMAYGIIAKPTCSNVSVTYTDEKRATSGMQSAGYRRGLSERISSRNTVHRRRRTRKRRRAPAQDGDVAYTTEVAVSKSAVSSVSLVFLPLFWRWFERAAPLVCWLVIIAASTISDLLILWETAGRRIESIKQAHRERCLFWV